MHLYFYFCPLFIACDEMDLYTNASSLLEGKHVTKTYVGVGVHV